MRITNVLLFGGCLMALAAAIPLDHSSRFSAARDMTLVDAAEGEELTVTSCQKGIDKLFAVADKAAAKGKSLWGKVKSFFKDTYGKLKKYFFHKACDMVKDKEGCRANMKALTKLFSFEKALIAAKSTAKAEAACESIAAVLCKPKLLATGEATPETQACIRLPPGVDLAIEVLKEDLVGHCKTYAAKGVELVQDVEKKVMSLTELKTESALANKAMETAKSAGKSAHEAIEAAGGVGPYMNLLRSSIIDELVVILLNEAHAEMKAQIDKGVDKLQDQVKGTDTGAKLAKAGLEVGGELATQFANLAIQKVAAKIGCDLSLDEAEVEGKVTTD